MTLARTYNEMDGHHAFSSSDLVNWEDHGEILHTRDLSWGVSGLMWAPALAYMNTKANGTCSIIGRIGMGVANLRAIFQRNTCIITKMVPLNPFIPPGKVLEDNDRMIIFMIGPANHREHYVS